MRVTLQIDSATDEEMRRALLAWHFTTPAYKKPPLVLDGLVVKVCGSSWNIESPPIEPKRAEQIIEATKSQQHLGWLKLWRDETVGAVGKSELEVEKAWREYLADANTEQLKEV